MRHWELWMPKDGEIELIMTISISWIYKKKIGNIWRIRFLWIFTEPPVGLKYYQNNLSLGSQIILCLNWKQEESHGIKFWRTKRWCIKFPIFWGSADYEENFELHYLGFRISQQKVSRSLRKFIVKLRFHDFIFNRQQTLIEHKHK